MSKFTTLQVLTDFSRPLRPDDDELIVRMDRVPARHREGVYALALAVGLYPRPAGSPDNLELREGEPVAIVGDVEYAFPIAELRGLGARV